MRVLALTNTAVDLNAQVAPFQPNNTVVICNQTAGQLVLQDSDASGSGFGTLATLAAGEFQEVTFDKQYAKVSTVATLYALGN
jgi:hypothetical protein